MNKGILVLAIFMMLILLSLSCAHSFGTKDPLQPLKQMGAYDLINSWMPGAETVATTIQSSVLLLKEEKDKTTIVISLKPLKKISKVTFRDGYLSVRKDGHEFRVYLLLAGKCVRASMDAEDRIKLTIKQYIVTEEPGTIVEAGNYPVFMVEDGIATWAWDLQPAFPDAVLPESGGFDPGEAFLLSETQNRLNDCK